jgi:DNA modification methylase
MSVETVTAWPPEIGVTPYYADDRVAIYNGDALTMLSSLPTVNLLLMDPPYGIALEEHGRNGYDWSVDGDESQATGDMALLWASGWSVPTITFAHPMKPWQGKWRQHLVWNKGGAVGGGGDMATCWKQSWELLQVARTGRLNGPRDEAVLNFPIGQTNYSLHPCQKPLPLISYLIHKATHPGDVIVDPFAGSFTTAVAAKKLGRRCIAIELRKDYCEIGKNRCRQGVLI